MDVDVSQLPVAKSEPAKKVVDKITALAGAFPFAEDRARFCQIAVSVANMAHLANCTPSSVVKGIYGCALLGLIPETPTGHAYLVPFFNKNIGPEGAREATLIVGYRGFIDLARRGGLVTSVHSEIVYANDAYDEDRGSERRIYHRPWYVEDNVKEAGDPWLVYCIADMRDGSHQFETMTREEIHDIKARAKTSKIWNSDPQAMWRKTVVRRASKFWPLSPTLARAVEWDEQAERGDRQTIDPMDVVDIDAAGEIDEADPLTADPDAPSAKDQEEMRQHEQEKMS